MKSKLLPTGYKVSAEKWKELGKARKRFNEVISYQRKHNPMKGYLLPEKASLKTIGKRIASEQDYQHELERLKSLAGNTDVVKTSSGIPVLKYSLEQGERDYEYREKVKANKRRQYGLSKYKGTDLIAERQNLQPQEKPEFEKLNQKQLNKVLSALERQSSKAHYNEQEEQYKKNFIEAIEKVWGAYGEPFKELVEDLDTDDFIDMVFGRANAQIKDIYVEKGNVEGEVQRHLNYLESKGVIDEDKAEEIIQAIQAVGEEE